MRDQLNTFNGLGELSTHHPDFGYARTDRHPTCYLAGPMTGLPEFNQHAFKVCTQVLREAGWKVLSPLEMDHEDGIDLDGTTGIETFDFRRAMARDLKAVCEVDCVIVMPGWEESTGARLELHVAHEVGTPVYTYLSQRKIEALPEGECHRNHAAELSAVHSPPPSENAPSDYGFAWKSSREGYQVPIVKSDAENASAGSRSGQTDPLDVERVKGEGVTPASSPDILPTDSDVRKEYPIASGVLDYFPAALAEVANVSKVGNDKHNPGEPLHHARGKSMDHADCLIRHFIDRGKIDPGSGLRHSAQMAWRAMALLQEELEEAGAPLPRGARL